MMDIIDTLRTGEKVTSTYADNYFENASNIYSKKQEIKSPIKQKDKKETLRPSQNGHGENWVSPSDLLMGIIDLTPPFTSKITRGITHEGILAIGDEMLTKERQKFEAELRRLLHENDAAWNHILLHEKEQVKSKVEKIFVKIFQEKSQIMTSEMSHFYEQSLQELEDHLRTEIQQVLMSAHANIISDLNTEIKKKLKEERNILEKILEKQFRSEVQKITTYYTLMTEYELNRNDRLISRALHERNDALNIFYKTIDAEITTSTMYVLSMERKKCRIKQFLLENYQSSEIKKTLDIIRAKQEIIDSFTERERFVADINLEWKGKIKKVVQLFLKFISFSLKLLPEQATFLLDLEKMFILQLNEIQKQPESAPYILIDQEQALDNLFLFEETEAAKATCDKEPLEVVGDTSDTIPTPYGSRETLPSRRELPAITVLGNRRFVYAKCNKFAEVQAWLKTQVCKCSRFNVEETLPEKTVPEPIPVAVEPEHESIKSESSIELMQVDDIKRMQECPTRYCRDWAKLWAFDKSPYTDYTEENFKVVLNRLKDTIDEVKPPEIQSAKQIAHKLLPFVGGTNLNLHLDAATQCSSDEDIPHTQLFGIDGPDCTCVIKPCTNKSHDFSRINSKTNFIDETMAKRKTSMNRLLLNNVTLLKMFTDESYDVKF